MSRNLKTLKLSVAPPDPERPNNPVVTILIDGKDKLAELSSGFIGFDPADVLDTGALLPTDPPRRVAVYCCCCGEAGCGCVAPIIDRIGDRIRWRDFRDFTGVYGRPLDAPDRTGGTPHALADIEFDAAHCLREVERATNDRRWETPARKTARLLLDILRHNDEHFTKQGYWLGWVTPHWNEPDQFNVEFIGPRGQIVDTFAPTTDTPEERAAEMAGELLETEPSRWAVEGNPNWSPDDVRTAVAARQAERDRW